MCFYGVWGALSHLCTVYELLQSADATQDSGPEAVNIMSIRATAHSADLSLYSYFLSHIFSAATLCVCRVVKAAPLLRTDIRAGRKQQQSTKHISRTHKREAKK